MNTMWRRLRKKLLKKWRMKTRGMGKRRRDQRKLNHTTDGGLQYYYGDEEIFS